MVSVSSSRFCLYFPAVTIGLEEKDDLQFYTNKMGTRLTLYVTIPTKALPSFCAGLGLGRVNFLPSGCCEDVFWISAENRADILEMFLLLLSDIYC